jgi:hypothetical protein
MKYPNYQLTDTFRLGEKAAKLTGIFYNGTLKSLSKQTETSNKITEGPILIPLEMQIGDPTPSNAIREAVKIAQDIVTQNRHFKIAILSVLVKTTTALQVEVARTIGNSNNILVETVARIQGITRDVTIYVIPNTDSMIHSLDLRVFNVATSRAKINTYIIAPNDIKSYSCMPDKVRRYLNSL